MAMLVSVSLLFISCQNDGRDGARKGEIMVSYEFPESNWTFEDQVLNMQFDVEDTTKNYSITFYLNYDTTANKLQELPLNITLVYPDGMETFVTSKFIFDPVLNKAITPTGKGGVCNMSLVAFPKKHLSQKGTYSVILYRKAEKYDNYGFNKITLKVAPVGKAGE